MCAIKSSHVPLYKTGTIESYPHRIQFRRNKKAYRRRHIRKVYCLNLIPLLGCLTQALGIGTAFRKHPVDMNFFQHGYKNIFSSLCNYMLTNQSGTDPPTYTPPQLHTDQPIWYRPSHLHTTTITC